MDSRPRILLSEFLPIAAILSLVFGPGPAAVRAEYRHQLAEKSQKERAERQTEAQSPTATSEHPSKQTDEPRKNDASFVSVVAPATPKPADVETSSGMSAVSGSKADAQEHSGRQGSVESADDSAHGRPHHPVYRAHAPPTL